jgi:hypothetical protein
MIFGVAVQVFVLFFIAWGPIRILFGTNLFGIDLWTY